MTRRNSSIGNAKQVQVDDTGNLPKEDDSPTRDTNEKELLVTGWIDCFLPSIH
jgi:hypothetical protein